MACTAEYVWDCFIAYPGSERHHADEFARQVGGRIRLFVDHQEIRPGDHWPQRLAEALEASLVTVVVVAPATERAFYEGEEITRATDRARDPREHRRVVPVFVNGMTAEDKRVPYGLRTKQGLTVTHFEDWAEVAEKLIALIRDLSRQVESEASGDEPDSVSPSIRDHLAAVSIEVDRLTRDQYRVINQLRFLRRVRVSGAAGSGKTLVAAEKAIRLAKAGVSVLFLCHNPLLAEHVQRLTTGSDVEVCDFTRWVEDLVGSAPPSQESDWSHYDEPTQQALDRAFETLISGRGRVQAVVVDEGQDFRPEWWSLVEACLEDPKQGWLYIFHDNNQSLLAHRADYPIEEPHVDLSRNCRNAGQVLDLMRCFDSGAPEPELALRTRGRVRLAPYEQGAESATLAKVLTELDGNELLDSTVVLTTEQGPLKDSSLAGVRGKLGADGSWQQEVRKQFSKVLGLYNSRGVTKPNGGEAWVSAELAHLSDGAYPSVADIERVRRVANCFSLTYAIRAEIAQNPMLRNGFTWQLSSLSPRLRRRSVGPVLAAELLMHYQREDWHTGLPEPKSFSLRPFSLPPESGSIPLYRVPDFKGLESDAVVLMMRGRVGNQREVTYVGVSRARTLLYVIADRAAVRTLPKSFRWD